MIETPRFPLTIACPLCEWVHSEPPPMADPAALASVFGRGVMSAISINQTGERIERALEQHFKTHTLVEWVHRVSFLHNELDAARMRLTLCGVAAICNDEQSMTEQCLTPDHKYSSDSFRLVLRVVRSEMTMRALLRRALAEPFSMIEAEAREAIAAR